LGQHGLDLLLLLFGNAASTPAIFQASDSKPLRQWRKPAHMRRNGVENENVAQRSDDFGDPVLNFLPQFLADQLKQHRMVRLSWRGVPCFSLYRRAMMVGESSGARIGTQQFDLAGLGLSFSVFSRTIFDAGELLGVKIAAASR
jgi:hypothetical protein